VEVEVLHGREVELVCRELFKQLLKLGGSTAATLDRLLIVLYRAEVSLVAGEAKLERIQVQRGSAEELGKSFERTFHFAIKY